MTEQTLPEREEEIRKLARQIFEEEWAKRVHAPQASNGKPTETSAKLQKFYGGPWDVLIPWVRMICPHCKGMVQIYPESITFRFTETGRPQPSGQSAGGGTESPETNAPS